MLLFVRVDGFRSLADFELTINPGLNILVGPNGGGKTNIVQFFEFLAMLLDRSISEAVSQSGGAGAVFRKTGEESYQQDLRVAVVGRIRTEQSTSRYLNYNYSFVARISDQRDMIYFEEQRLCAKFSPRMVKASDLIPVDQHWDLEIHQKSDSNLNVHTKLESLDRRKFSTRIYTPGKQNRSQILKAVEDIIQANSNPELSILWSSRLSIFEIQRIRDDFSGERVFNIIPSRVKQSEDSAKPPGIQKDGSGLAATLYALSHTATRRAEQSFVGRAREFTFRRSNLPIRHSFATMRQVVSFSQLVNPAITAIEVRNDPFDNQLKILVSIKSSHGSVPLPFSSMSDGTIKWISLITAVLTYRTVFSVEEPENYIHPLMQREILKIMRDNATSRHRRSFILLSTHSETLLNAANPREVIVVTMKDGITKVHRPDGRRRMKRLIAESGFGLGHLYLTGALDNG